MIELSGHSVKNSSHSKEDIEIKITGLSQVKNYMKNFFYLKILKELNIQKILNQKNLL